MSQAEWENLASLLSLVVSIIAALALWLELIPRCWVEACAAKLEKAAQLRLVWMLLLPALSLMVNVLIAEKNGVPVPVIHDEFSYLLAADTFAHGRLTNPTPPFYEHFETPHELMKPTYMSKYPPGEGLTLAMGQELCGLPIAGVWLSTAAAVLAIYWMLLAFSPPVWALVGGVVAGMHPQLLDWSQNYWGGSVAVLGGALVIGSWGRLMIVHGNLSAIWLAIGLIVLANTRPFEGLVLSLPLMIALLATRRGQCLRLLLPSGVPLLLGAAWMGYYNFRVTGHVLRLPYLEYVSQYEIYPKLWFLSPRPSPLYHDATMAFVHQEFDRQAYAGFQSWRGAVVNTEVRLGLLYTTTLDLVVLAIPLAVTLFTRKTVRLKWVTMAAALVAIAVWADIFFYQHYLAPMIPSVILLIIVGWQKIAGWHWQNRPVGTWLSVAIGIGFLAGATFVAALPVDRTDVLVEQQAMIRLLPTLQQGRHLIFVTYAPLHSLHVEYVHNQSDLDQSQIIWARSFGPASDRPVAERFAGRTVWLLNVGGKLDLQPYAAMNRSVGTRVSGKPEFRSPKPRIKSK